MPRLLDHLTDLFKKTDTIDHALRYYAVFYSPVRKMLRELDSMPRAGARGASRKLGAWIETSVRRIVLHLPKSFIDRGVWCCIA